MGSGSLYIFFYLPRSSPGWMEARMPGAAWGLAGAARALPRWWSGLSQALHWSQQGVVWGSGRLSTGLPRCCEGLSPKLLGLSGVWEAFPGSAWALEMVQGLQASPRLNARLLQVLPWALSCGTGRWQALCQAPKVLLRAPPGTAGDCGRASGCPKFSWDLAGRVRAVMVLSWALPGTVRGWLRHCTQHGCGVGASGRCCMGLPKGLLRALPSAALGPASCSRGAAGAACVP